MVQRVSLDNVSPADFERLTDLLTVAIQEREVKIRMWVPSTIELIFDSARMSQSLERNELPVGACVAQLNGDIPIMLSAILMRQQIQAAAYLATVTDLTEPGLEIQDDEQREELTRSEVLQRCAVLEEKVIDDELRTQYAIKVTAKNNVLTGTEWEVVQRQSDGTNDSVDNLIYATFRFILQKPPIRLIRYVGNPQESDTVTLILTTEEIIELRSVLEEALAAIERATQTGGRL